MTSVDSLRAFAVVFVAALLQVVIVSSLVIAGAAPDLLLVVGKSQDWVWPTVRALVRLRDKAEATPARLKRIFVTYEQLSRWTSQRVVHFLKLRESAQKQAAGAAAQRQIRAKRH